MKHRGLAVIACTLLLAIVPSQHVLFAQSSSPNYQVEEALFGTGGEVDMTSLNYQAQGSAGSLGVGSVSSTNYDADPGFLTPYEPFLEMFVDNITINLGDLTPTAAAYGSGTFSVRTYLSSEYSVKTLSAPPTNESGGQLNPMTSGGTSSPGTEQFGINLRNNSSPDIGADLFNDPADSFADGEIAAGYGTVDNFRYVDGESIARSPKTNGNQGTGKTIYTISYLANVSSITEAGIYTMNHNLVVVATY